MYRMPGRLGFIGTGKAEGDVFLISLADELQRARTVVYCKTRRDGNCAQTQKVDEASEVIGGRKVLDIVHGAGGHLCRGQDYGFDLIIDAFEQATQRGHFLQGIKVLSLRDPGAT